MRREHSRRRPSRSRRGSRTDLLRAEESDRIVNELERLRRENESLRAVASNSVSAYDESDNDSFFSDSEMTGRSSHLLPQDRDYRGFRRHRSYEGGSSARPPVVTTSDSSGSSINSWIPRNHSLLNLVPPLIREGGYLWRASKTTPKRRWFRIAIQRRDGCNELALTWCDPRSVENDSQNSSTGFSSPEQKNRTMRSFTLANVVEILSGHESPGWWAQASERKAIPAPDLCWSLVSQDEGTLDLAAESIQEAHLWKEGLSRIVAKFRGLQNHQTRILGQQRNAESHVNTRRRRSVGHVVMGTQPPLLSPDTYTTSNNFQRAAESPLSPSRVSTGSAQSQQRLAAAVRGKRREEVIGLLSSRLVDPDQVIDTKTGDTALLLACRLGDKEMVGIVLGFGAKNDPHPTWGGTALQIAVCGGYAEAARALLASAKASGADAAIANHVILASDNKLTKGDAPLHVAAKLLDQSTVQLLLEHHADVLAKDVRGRTPAHVAVETAQDNAYDILALLLDGANDTLLDALDDVDGNSLLHVAARSGARKCVELLLQAAANATAMNNAGETPREAAIHAGNYAIAGIIHSYEENSRKMQTAGFIAGTLNRVIPESLRLPSPSKHSSRRVVPSDDLSQSLRDRKYSLDSELQSYDAGHAETEPRRRAHTADYVSGSAWSMPDSGEQGHLSTSESISVTTCWDAPETPANYSDRERSGDCGAGSFTMADGEQWMELFCEQEQYPYFLQVSSGHTQWLDPRTNADIEYSSSTQHLESIRGYDTEGETVPTSPTSYLSPLEMPVSPASSVVSPLKRSLSGGPIAKAVDIYTVAGGKRAPSPARSKNGELPDSPSVYGDARSANADHESHKDAQDTASSSGRPYLRRFPSESSIMTKCESHEDDDENYQDAKEDSVSCDADAFLKRIDTEEQLIEELMSEETRRESFEHVGQADSSMPEIILEGENDSGAPREDGSSRQRESEINFLSSSSSSSSVASVSSSPRDTIPPTANIMQTTISPERESSAATTSEPSWKSSVNGGEHETVDELEFADISLS